MQTLEITTIHQVQELTQHLTENVHWFEEKSIEISDSLPVVRIHLKGEKFNSSITTGLMKAILHLQDSIYRNYSLYAYGYVTRLSTEEREALELCVKIEPGSSIVDIIIKEIANEVGKRVKKMTNKQLAATVATIAILGVGYFGVNRYADYRQKITELQMQHEHDEEVQKIAVAGVIDMLKEQSAFLKELSKQNFDTVELAGTELSPAELKELTKGTREYHQPISVPYTGDFTITDIHIQEDNLFIDVIKDDGTTIKYINIVKSMISQDDYDWLKESAEHRPVKMTIVATERNGEQIAAYLQNFEK